MNYLVMTSLMFHYMEFIEYRTTHVNLIIYLFWRDSDEKMECLFLFFSWWLRWFQYITEKWQPWWWYWWWSKGVGDLGFKNRFLWKISRCQDWWFTLKWVSLIGSYERSKDNKLFDLYDGTLKRQSCKWYDWWLNPWYGT